MSDDFDRNCQPISTWTLAETWIRQGSKDAWNALGCRSLSAKEPLIKEIFCGKRHLPGHGFGGGFIRVVTAGEPQETERKRQETRERQRERKREGEREREREREKRKRRKFGGFSAL